ncbi:MAG: methylmalonyl Co-A mutase-associated GTPase MeaB [Myxococcota bacterium]
MRADLEALSDGVAAADKGAVGRALNLVEDRRRETRLQVAELLAKLDRVPRTREGQRVGLTGPPGVGKSSLVAVLARTLRERGRSVGIVAIDPTSVQSGGSLLGDRARMGFDPADRQLFVRSLATAGEAGGLAYAVNAAVRVLAAAFDVVLVETTGVGQSETDVVHVADTVALVVQPGSGDALQFLKAGIMEIPDVLVVNKADHEELAHRTVTDLRGALRSAHAAGVFHGDGSWEVPIVATSAQDGRGLDDLVQALDAHRAHLGGQGLTRRRRAGEVAWVSTLLLRQHGEHGLETLGGKPALARHIEEQLRGGASPVALAEQLGAQYLERLRTGA